MLIMSSFSVSAAVLALMAIARTSCASTTTVALAFSPSPPHCRRTTLLFKSIHGKYPTHPSRQSAIIVSSSSDDDSTQNNEEAARLQQKAQELRAQIRQMESQIGEERRARYNGQLAKNPIDEEPTEGKRSLKDKRILIVGANGRLGAMVTRHLLRTHGSDVKEVVAACHYIGEATTRGYGRLSYEVGAEDGVGSIGAAWSSEEERNASFEYNPQVMGGYNLNKLRVVEVELLNPTQVNTITENVDAIIYCATDFEGNRPRAIASLNAAFLFRAVASPLKGRVEIEGVRNCLEGLTGGMNDRRWKEKGVGAVIGSVEGEKATSVKSTEPTQFVLVSTAPDVFKEFETPFGEFIGLKRQGEYILTEEFPSVTYSVLQMGRYDERVEEGSELLYEDAEDDTVVVDGVIGAKDIDSSNNKRNDGKQKRINRRDAAKAAVEALLDADLERKKVQVYTSIR